MPIKKPHSLLCDPLRKCLNFLEFQENTSPFFDLVSVQLTRALLQSHEEQAVNIPPYDSTYNFARRCLA